MKVSRHTVVPALAVLAAVALAACEPTPVDSAPSKSDVAIAPSPSATATEETADEAFDRLQEENRKAQEEFQDKIDAAASKAAASEAAVTAEVPDVVGMIHGEAQTLLRSKGFMVNEEDANGDRFVLNNSNWKVCRQDPAPGNHPLTVRVAIYSVKLDESC